MDDLRTLDVTDEATFGRLPPCADPGFDHRSCDYWEDDARGSKAARLDWLTPAAPPVSDPTGRPARPPTRSSPTWQRRGRLGQPVRPGRARRPAPTRSWTTTPTVDNPFAPPPKAGPAVPPTAPRKLRLPGRGLGVVGSYAKVLVRGDETAGVLPVRAADRLPARPADARPVPTAPGLAAAGRHHLHRDGPDGAPARDRAPASWTSRLRGPRGSRVRRRRGVPGGRDAAGRDERRHAGLLGAAGFVRAVDDPRFPVMRRELA